MKKVWILNILSKVLAEKNLNQTIQQRSTISNGNNNTLSFKYLNLFWIILAKLCQILAKITEKVNKNSNAHKTSNLDNSL